MTPSPADRRGWVDFSHSSFGLRFRYPTVSPDGHAVQVIQDERNGAHRVHLSSPPSGEVYVEVMRAPDIDAAREYARHREYLEGRFGAGAVDELRKTTFGTLPAWRYAFRGGELVRAVLSIPVGTDLCRIVFDPRSPLNDEIIASVVIDG